MEQKNLKPLYTAAPAFVRCGEIFATYAADAFGILWTVGEGGLYLCADDTLAGEEYRLVVDGEKTTVYAATEKGMHNGLANLLWLLELATEETALDENGIAMPKVEICQKPDMPYRGLMVDLARQWHPIEYLYGYVDLCWKNRASHLQLHFTDSQSFTLPMKAYPQLCTEGRTYTREEIASLVEYAKERGIELVPEVDVPGHTDQFFLKYPEVFGNAGVLPACEEVFEALRTIFAEVADMFPHSPWIHLGGDEAAIGGWEQCERTQAYMEAHGIANIHEMYAEYIRIVTEMIFALDRTPVVWEGFAKAYNDRIDRRTIIIAWESYYQPAYDLAEAGFTLINCSWKPLYIVTPDTHWTPTEIAALDPWHWDHWWEKSVAFPDGYSIDQSYPVLGQQICAWGDRIAGWENWEDGIKREMELVAERLPAMCSHMWHLDMHK